MKNNKRGYYEYEIQEELQEDTKKLITYLKEHGSLTIPINIPIEEIDMQQEKVVRLAKIDDEIVPYDLCSELKRFYGIEHYTYIGAGRIYSIDGIHQTGENVHHFFVEKEK